MGVDNAPVHPALAALSPEERTAAYAQITGQLWETGRLRYKLHETQLKIYEAIQANTHRRHFVCCSRRLGKTYMLVALAFETALQKPGARILFLAPQGKDAKEISVDIAAKILEDCPPEIRPEFNGQDKEYRFKNGSIIRHKGTNGDQAQFLRGGAADLVIMDEAGMMDNLQQVLNSVVEPMTLTTKGRIIIATTPSMSPGHECAAIYERFASLGCVSQFTLRDAPHIAHEEKYRSLLNAGEKADRIDRILDGTLEPETTTAQREYFCEWVTDASAAVVREFDAEARAEIVVQHPRPHHFDAYTAMDPGMRDRTGILFAYWDFLQAKLVIEDEALLTGPPTSKIASVIKEREHATWGFREPYIRVSDVDPRLIADLWELHRLRFQRARKEDSLGAVNLMRNDVLTRTLVINPRCVNLIRQLKNATWNKAATDFARPQSEQAIDGHYDLVAALKYLCRTVVRNKNPYPANWRQTQHGPNAWISPKSNTTGDRKKLGLFQNTPVGRRLAGLKPKK